MKFESFVELRKTILLDGATGSQLIEMGLKSGELPELWNVEHPEEITQIANLYFDSGSDVVYTNSFGGSALKLKNYGLEKRTYEINFAAAKNSLAAKRENKYVLGSIGPSSKLLKPFGDVSEQEMINAFIIQAEALADGGVDGYILETFTDINEIECAIKAVKEKSDLPFITSMTFDKTPNGFYTMMGISVEEAAYKLMDLGAFAIGSNCGNGIQRIIEIGKEFRKVSAEMKILLKANAGVPKYINNKTVYSEDAEFFGSFFEELISINPAFIGGCCGTTPEHIKIFRKLIDNNGY